jgi:hypothetical protein
MEVTRDSIDFKEPIHSAASLGVDVLDHLGQLVLILKLIIAKLLILGEADFLEIVMHIHQMHFEYILDVEGEEGTRVAWELNVDVDLQLLGEVFLVDDEVTVYSGRAEIDDRHNAKKEEQRNGGDRDARSGDGSLAVVAGNSLIEIDRSQSFFEARKHR